MLKWLPILFLALTAEACHVSRIRLPGFTAPAYRDKDYDTMLNLFPESFVDALGQKRYKLVSASGLSPINSATNNQPCRTAILGANGEVFSLHGNTVYYISGTSILTFTSLGTIGTSTGRAEMIEGTGQILLVDGTSAWVINTTTHALTQVTDVNFPSSPISCTFLDSRFIVVKGGTGKFYVSELNDALDWTPSVFATAESRADNLQAVRSNSQNLACIGERTVELWMSSGDTTLPYTRIPGATYEIGTPAGATAGMFGGAVYLLGSSDGGAGGVYRLTNSLKKISTPIVEGYLQNYAYLSPYGFCYSERGHDFYVITVPTATISFVYDIGEDAWHTRSWTTNGTTMQASRISKIINRNSAYPMAFDRIDGGVSEVADGAFENTSATNYRQRYFGPITIGGGRLTHDMLEILVEVVTGSISSDTITGYLSKSDDAGVTWSSEVAIAKAISGAPAASVMTFQFARLGSAYSRRYRFRIKGTTSTFFSYTIRDAFLTYTEARF